MRRAVALACLLLAAGAAGAQELATSDPPAPAVAPPAAPPTPPEPAPTMIDQTGVAPDGSPRDIDEAWDARIRTSLANAQSLQGPLDGGWTLVGADHQPILSFQFVDPAGGRGPLEGVWRDLRRPAGTYAYGTVWSLERFGGSLNLSYFPPGSSKPVQVSLRGDGVGWTGQMTEDGVATTVILRRR